MVKFYKEGEKYHPLPEKNGYLLDELQSPTSFVIKIYRGYAL